MANKKPNKANKGIVFTGIAFELLGLCVGGFYLGQQIDQHFGWKGTAQTYLVLLLLVGWFIHLIILLQKFEKENAHDDPPQP